MGSETAKDLSEILGALRVRSDGDYVPKIGHVVVNFGSAKVPDWMGRAQARNVKMLNRPDAVNIASNKLATLQALQRANISIPEFTTDIHKARQWVGTGYTVVERHNLRGNSGDGIRIVNIDDEEMSSNIEYAPLYTKFIEKTAEFRVHVFRGEVIDYIEKKKVSTERRPENFNKYVCSNNLGWVFVRNNIRDIPEVKDIAKRATQVLGLDFAAVDVVYHEGRPYVLEVNTAPGLTGTTLVKYGNAFRRYLGKADLSQDVVNRIMIQDPNPAPDFTAAAQVASVSRTQTAADEVVLRIDRITALKLKSLLASIQ